MNHKLRKENRNMKKYILSAIALAGVFFMTSCEDFLQPTSEGAYSSDTYFQTDQQAIDAVDALYDGFQDEACFGREYMWEQGAANDFVWGRTRSYPTMATLTITGSTGPLNDVWGRLTGRQQRANWVIDQLLKKQAKGDLTAIETRSLGEAYFCRALAHFYIAYRYGTNKQGVPFVRYEDFADGYDYSIPPQRATVMENYQLIIEDLDKAEALLPTVDQYADDDFGRAHKAACAGYKAKVYAYWACWDKSQYANVITEVNKMISQYGRDLAEDFTDNFTSDYDKWRNKEYVWTIPSEGGGSGKGGIEFVGVSLDNGAWGYMNGWGQFKPSLDIFKEMQKDTPNLAAGTNNDDDNYRLRKSILEYGQKFTFFGDARRFYSTRDVESGFMIAKYLEPFSHDDPITNGYVSDNGDWPTARINFPLLRFADCLLLRAEAYLATGNAAGATADINKIRARVGIKNLPGNATWADLYHERRCELAFEHSDHLYDLKRWAVGAPSAEIKALAIAELEKHPDARHYIGEDGSENGQIQDVNYDGEKLFWEKDPAKFPTEGSDYENKEADKNYKTTEETPYRVMVAARACWAAPFVEGPYYDYQAPAKKWEDYKIVFPYRDSEISNANGALKQNDGY